MAARKTSAAKRKNSRPRGTVATEPAAPAAPAMPAAQQPIGASPEQAGKGLHSQAPGEAPPSTAGVRVGRSTVPAFMNDPEQRAAVGLPRDEAERGQYMVELNLLHW